MDNEHFPHVGAGPTSLHPELYLRDVEMINYHINHDKWDLIRQFDIIDTVRWVDDFLFEEVDLYTIAQDAGGSNGVADMINGVFFLTNHTDNDDDSDMVQDAETWQLLDGYPLYFECRVKIDDATESDFYVGLLIGAGYFSAGTTDAVIFWKPDGGEDIVFRSILNSVATDVDTGIDMADATWIRLAFHWDGAGNLRWFVFTDGDAPQACAATGVITTGYCQDELLNFAWGIRNGEAAAKTAYIDYYKIAMRRYA